MDSKFGARDFLYHINTFLSELTPQMSTLPCASDLFSAYKKATVEIESLHGFSSSTKDIIHAVAGYDIDS
jgi:hypothetical protein